MVGEPVDIVILNLPLAGTGSIQVRIQGYRGRTKLHLRRWYVDDTGHPQATRMGVATTLDQAIEIGAAWMEGIEKMRALR